MKFASTSTYAILFFLWIAITHSVDWDVVTPLDEYVNRPDPTYSWHEIEQIQGDGYVVHVLNFTSQKWMDDSFVEEPVWWHYLNIFVPTAPLIHNAAMIHIGHGSHQAGIPTLSDSMMRRTGNFCRHVGSVAAYLTTVPFEPVHFVGDYLGNTNRTRTRTEDQIIAYTWSRFVEDPESKPESVLLLPMTKAAKLALDTIQEFMVQEYTGYQIEKFMTIGYSKRGWTSWLLASVDRRIFAVVPIVFNLLNMQDNLEHHYRMLGGWSWAFTQYWSEGVTRYLYHSRAEEMEKFMDPIEYTERMTMPKLVVNGCGDQFLPPDGSHYFYDALNGQKFIQLWENDDHTLDAHQSQIDHNVEAFFLSVYRGEQLPRITWTRSENDTHGIITVQTSPSVISIRGWNANTTLKTCEENRNGTCRRDFRQAAINGNTGIVWYPTDVTQTGVDQYLLALAKPEFGYRGFFIEMTFEGPANYVFRFTTEVQIVPDTHPYLKCESEEECQGRLI